MLRDKPVFPFARLLVIWGFVLILSGVELGWKFSVALVNLSVPQAFKFL